MEYCFAARSSEQVALSQFIYRIRYISIDMGIADKFRGLNLEEDFIELDISEEEAEDKVAVQVEKLQNLADAERIQHKVREGRVLLVKVRDLRARDISELRRALERVKRTCHAVDGDIAGLGEDWVLACGAQAKVHRQETE